jgi:hypothetical protein
MKTTVAACLFALTSSLASPLSSGAEKPLVVFDRAHGQPEIFERMVVGIEKHAELRRLTEPLTGAMLAGARMLYVRGPSKPFTADEKKAVVDFLRKGGSMLLVVDEQRRDNITETGVNDLIEPFGLELTGDTEYLHNCGGIARAGEIHAADREIPYSGGRAVQGGTPFAYRLDADGKPAEAFAAYRKLASGGRVVVMGEGMASILLGSLEGARLTGIPRDPGNTAYWGKDSAVFMDEVTAWLLAR